MTMEWRSACELRASGDKSAPRLHGYAAVFDSASLDLGGFTEIVNPGAFTRTLASNESDPLALVHHLPHLVLGRRSAGTLRLNEDKRGLAFEIDLPDTQTARDLLVNVERGDIRGASFAFTVPKGGDAWEVRGGNVVRHLRDVTLHEITITPAPAYTDTSVARRFFASRYSPPPYLRSARLFLETV
jgi:HK97 family phage prohead protease